MAITINGAANTVAGLAVGGLPDGTVDNDTLAAGAGKPANNAITNALLADDAVGVAELSATGTASATTFLRGDNAWAAAGGGKVLQVIHSKETSTTYTPAKDDSNLTDFAAVNTNLTPAHVNNKVLCIASTQYEASGAFNAGFRIRNTTSSTNVTTHSPMQLSRNSAHERQTAFIIGYDHPNSTSAQTYKVQGNNWSAADTSAVFGGNGAGITLTLIEIDLS